MTEVKSRKRKIEFTPSPEDFQLYKKRKFDDKMIDESKSRQLFSQLVKNKPTSSINFQRLVEIVMETPESKTWHHVEFLKNIINGNKVPTIITQISKHLAFLTFATEQEWRFILDYFSDKYPIELVNALISLVQESTLDDLTKQDLFDYYIFRTIGYWFLYSEQYKINKIPAFKILNHAFQNMSYEDQDDFFEAFEIEFKQNLDRIAGNIAFSKTMVSKQPWQDKYENLVKQTPIFTDFFLS